MLKRSGLLLAGAAALVATGALSAEFPKSGQTEFDMYAVVRNRASIDSGSGSGGIKDCAGVTCGAFGGRGRNWGFRTPSPHTPEACR